jgi:aquaporin Z
MLDILKRHWPEYLMEAAELGIFMISASVFTMLLYHPASPAIRAIPPEFVRRVLIGLAMGLTLVGLVYSPWGKQSGAHMNPAFTLTFFRLGKVAPWDAAFYIAAQFVGGMIGVAVVAAVAANWLAHPSVNYVATVPGPGGPWVAFIAETAISFLLVMVVLIFINRSAIASFTGIAAGICVAVFITFESPYSGMSMNPARTFGSALLPHLWNALWVYFSAPLLGMLLAAEVYVRLKHHVGCAKYHHQNKTRCIFCEYQAGRNPPAFPGRSLCARTEQVLLPPDQHTIGHQHRRGKDSLFHPVLSQHFESAFYLGDKDNAIVPGGVKLPRSNHR